jgi:hypothetical protein
VATEPTERARLRPSVTDLGGLIESGAPVPGYKRGVMDQNDVHERMRKDVADRLAASADVWEVA